MIRSLDYAAFAAANFLLGVIVARLGGVDELAGFSFSVSVALILNSLFKSVVINPLSLTVRGVFRRYISACLLYVSVCFLGMFVLYVFVFVFEFGSFSTENVFFPLCIWFALIDFMRMLFLKKGKELLAPITSMSFLLLVIGLLFAGDSLTEKMFVSILICSSLILSAVFVFYFRDSFYISSGFFVIKKNLMKFSVYWFANSATVHLPILFASKTNPTVAAAFFVLRTIYNSFSVAFRPMENKYRFIISEGEDNKRLFWEMYSRVLLSLILLTLFLVVFGDDLIYFLWPVVAAFSTIELVAFCIYILLLWFLIFCEPAFFSDRYLLVFFRRAKICELTVLCVLFLFVIIYEYDFGLLDFVVIVSLPMFILLPWLIVALGKRVNIKNR